MEQSDLLLVDLHPVDVLAGQLRRILESVPGIKVTILNHRGHNQSTTSDLKRVASELKPCAVFILWPAERTRDACEFLPYIKVAAPGARLVAVTDSDDQRGLLDVLKAGADDAMTLPRDTPNVSGVMGLIESPDNEDSLVSSIKQSLWLKQLVGRSSAFLSEIRNIPLLARCKATVLITGETGTGKELCARAIHYLSGRAGNPFVGVNCGALPLDLVENELFGHERGAYTGANASQVGLVAEAEGGTLMLDEVDSLPLQAQVKLLRFLQEKEYRPLGSSRTKRADVRVIAATNSDLKGAVAEGRFREDLYYRLSVLVLRMPSLRERCEDIVLLARHFLKKYAKEVDRQCQDFSPDAMNALLSHSWPGNVRELEHVIERAVILSTSDRINATEIQVADGVNPCRAQSLQEAKAKVVAGFEKAYIQQLLTAHGGNITRAAEAAQKNRRAFFELIRKHNIDVGKFKTASS